MENTMDSMKYFGNPNDINLDDEDEILLDDDDSFDDSDFTLTITDSGEVITNQNGDKEKETTANAEQEEPTIKLDFEADSEGDFILDEGDEIPLDQATFDTTTVIPGEISLDQTTLDTTTVIPDEITLDQATFDTTPEVHYTTYEDVDNNRLNNIVINCNDSSTNTLIDADKLTPLCTEFLVYMHKLGYVPQNESFENFCNRTCSELFYGYDKEEIKRIMNSTEEYDKKDFSHAELTTLAQYLKVVKNADLPTKLLQYYVDYPIKFFESIALPFRKITYEEINLISECYQEPWYIDYIIPLFSLEARDTELILQLMKNNTFDENEALQYTKDLFKMHEYLKLKVSGGYVQGIFDTIGNKQEDIELYNVFANIVGDVDLAQSLFSRSDSDKLFILSYLKDIKKHYPTGEILLVNGNKLNLVDFIRRYQRDTYFLDLLKGVSNGVFNSELYNAILLIQPDNKQITASLMDVYATQPALDKYYEIYGNAGTAIIANDIDRFGYDYKSFSQAALSVTKAQSNVLSSLACFYYSEMFDMSLKDYKQWLAIISLDFKKYVQIIIDNSSFDILHFNKFWASYALQFLGFNQVEIGKEVKRLIVMKFTEKAQITLSLDAFIFYDGSAEQIFEECKKYTKFVTYDSDKKVLFFGIRKFFGKHSALPTTLKTSLEYVGEKDSLAEYKVEDKFSLISRFNMFSIVDNIDLFCEKNSSLYEMEYEERAKNFIQCCDYLLHLNYIRYTQFDTLFYVMSKIEPVYSLLMYCRDLETLPICLNNLNSLHAKGFDSITLFTRFVCSLYRKSYKALGKVCSNQSLVILNDARINQEYHNPISCEIFLKEIDYFVKMAANVPAILSVDFSMGSLCIDYQLQ